MLFLLFGHGLQQVLYYSEDAQVQELLLLVIQFPNGI
jgi:hypothetical protein